MSTWNSPETRPTAAGVYRVLSEGVEGFALWDQTDRIWGCTQPTIELAAREPEFFFSSQEKNWVELSDDQADLAIAEAVRQLGSVPEAQEPAIQDPAVTEVGSCQ